jgi:dephospho-CoA kinase
MSCLDQSGFSSPELLSRKIQILFSGKFIPTYGLLCHIPMITLIAVCGLGGSGKTTLGEYLRSNLSIPHYHIGQILVDECQRLHIDPTRDNKKSIGEKLGVIDQGNPLHFFDLSYQYMRSIYKLPRLVLFDALRSPLELSYLHEKENVLLIGVFVDKNERYKRLRDRNQKDRRLMTNQQIFERDLEELGLQPSKERYYDVGALLGLSDIFIMTTTSSKNLRPYDELVDYVSDFMRR